MMRSLRARLLAGTIAGMIALLTVFGIGIYAAVDRSLVDGFDASLAGAARAVAGQVEQKGRKLQFEQQDLKMPEFERLQHPDYFQIWQDDGTVLARSPSLGSNDLTRVQGTIDRPGFMAVVLPNGRPGRLAGLELPAKMEQEDEESGEGERNAENRTPAQARTVTVVVGRESAELEQQLRNLRWMLLGGSSAMVVLSLLVAAMVVRRGLRPLHSLAADIAGIDADQLGARVADRGLPTEMVPVAERLNDLLARLESAFQRERCFTADVAHELRTPLAGLQSVLEYALSRQRTAEAYREAFTDCLGISGHMRSMVDNLLMLARLDAGQVKLSPERIRPAELFEECWRLHSKRAAARSIVFENRLPADLECRADRGILSLVVSNVLANAEEYTDDGGRVCVQAVGAEPLRIAVTNTGCRLTQEEAAHVFERFWRGDPSRAGTGVHSGLGLALVQRAMSALGGAAAAGVLPDRVFRIELSLPGNGSG